MAAKEFIIAIELGSSKTTGIAGRKNPDGSITVLHVVKEDSSSFIHKGVVYNVIQTVQCITNIVSQLSDKLQAEVAQVYVGVGGQSIQSVKNTIAKDLPTDTIVTQQMVNVMMDTNRNMSYQDQVILDAAIQEYKVDNQTQIDPVGIPCSRLEGNFLNILWRKSFYTNLNKCFDAAKVNIAEMYLDPLVLSDSVLTDAEKRSGCILVDLGADTTTVSVYYKNILRHLAVIPLGGSSVTKDIASLQIDEAQAEKMKLKFASAYTENNDIDDKLELPIDAERSVNSRKFIEIVEGRMQEIIKNVWYQVPKEYSDRLLGGIILTGGGANMKNIDTAFRNITKMDKVRIAKFVKQDIKADQPELLAHNGTMNTILGLLAKGDMNCAGQDFNAPVEPQVTESSQVVVGVETTHQATYASGTMANGVVMSEEDRIRLQKAEEEARRAAEATFQQQQPKQPTAPADTAKKKDGGFRILGKKVKNFFQNMVKEEE